MKRNVLKNKYYTHVDTKKKASKYEHRVRSTQWVKQHGFFPFVHFQMVFKKYVTDNNGIKIRKDKIRNIYYAAHIDRFIYEYYGNRLNELYNIKAKELSINNAVIAYRNNKHGKNNVDFAKEVFEYIAKHNMVYIYVADFTDFFDTLDHNYLKDKVSYVMGVGKIPDTEYKIFKSITECAYIERDDILKYKQIESKDIKEMNKFFTTKELHDFKKKHLKSWGKNYGIPQGSSISSVYANVYMIDFDKAINDYITSKKGIYRRYCDDVIIAVPISVDDYKNKDYIKIKSFLMDIKNTIPNLVINDNKTEQFIFENKLIKHLDNEKSVINYLGFEFDGTTVRLREKSLFKYYCRAYKKVKSVNMQKGQNKIAAKKSLYRNYTHLGDRKYAIGRKNKNGKITFGNFITYARKSDDKFSNSELLKSNIHNQVKRHWNYINNKIEK